MSQKVTKKDLIEMIYARTGIRKSVIKQIIDVMIYEIFLEGLCEHKRFIFRGFGSLCIKKRKPRVGLNPKTREKIKIPEVNRVVFIPSRNLKERVKTCN